MKLYALVKMRKSPYSRRISSLTKVNASLPNGVKLARPQESITSIQETYGQDHLHLTIVKGYLAKLLGNARIVRYLMQHRPEFLTEFQAIADMTSTLPPEAA